MTNSAALVSPIFRVPYYFSVVPDPNPQYGDAQLCEFSKRADDGLSRASRLSKNVSWGARSIPCVERQSRIAARQSPGTRTDLSGWERGTLQSFSLSQDRKYILTSAKDT